MRTIASCVQLAVLLSACLASMPASSGEAAPAPGARAKAVPVIAPGSAYRQTNLVSDVAGVAVLQDPQLQNPWGIALTTTSPFWTANTGTSTSGLYRVTGPVTPSFNPGLALVSVPGGLPTGVVSNGTADFQLTAGNPARFLFASITGVISGWNANVPAAGSNTAIIKASLPGRVYTGLPLANNGGNFLYATDFANDAVDRYNASFVLQPAGGFVDPTIPKTVGNRFNAFNVQAIGGSIYVTYAKINPSTGLDVPGVGNGFVRRFNTAGVRDLTFAINNGALNSPWGIAIAPPSFGIFGGALLVGNAGAGNPSIHAYNPTTGAFLGTLQDEGGQGIQIERLWGLSFGNGSGAGDVNTLYATAGIGLEQHGLLVALQPTTASATSLVSFSSDEYIVAESSAISITVVREGDTTGTSTVRYAALPVEGAGRAGVADFTALSGTLTFLPGQTSQTFTLVTANDSLVEGEERLQLVLGNPTGSGLTAPNAEVRLLEVTLFANGFE